jgi:lipoprotein-releasing system permease protein
LRPLIEAAAERQVFITDWRQRNQTFFSALQVERNVMFMILTLIILVAALNIVSGLIMLVKDKGRDIAILRTMGATSGSVMRIFFMTGAAIGVTGTIAGFLLGVVVCLNVERIRQFFSWLSGTTLFNPDSISSASCPPTWIRAKPHRAGGGAGAVLHRDPDPVLAGLQARSGAGAAL